MRMQGNFEKTINFFIEMIFLPKHSNYDERDDPYSHVGQLTQTFYDCRNNFAIARDLHGSDFAAIPETEGIVLRSIVEPDDVTSALPMCGCSHAALAYTKLLPIILQI